MLLWVLENERVTKSVWDYLKYCWFTVFGELQSVVVVQFLFIWVSLILCEMGVVEKCKKNI
jgi:hypothetical protein